MRGAALAFAESAERVAEIILGRRPLERDALVGPFLERGAKGGDGRFEMRGAALAFAESAERVAEIILGCRPLERDALAGPLLEHGAKGGDCFFKALDA